MQIRRLRGPYALANNLLRRYLNFCEGIWSLLIDSFFVVKSNLCIQDLEFLTSLAILLVRATCLLILYIWIHLKIYNKTHNIIIYIYNLNTINSCGGQNLSLCARLKVSFFNNNMSKEKKARRKAP